MVNAGRVLIIPKGAWTNLIPYEMLDLVSEGDKAYLARQASVGVRPSEDASMTYWQPFGSSASIATTDTPGLVMPDGVLRDLANDSTRRVFFNTERIAKQLAYRRLSASQISCK